MVSVNPPPRAGTLKTMVRFAAWMFRLAPGNMAMMLGITVAVSLVPAADAWVLRRFFEGATALYAGRLALQQVMPLLAVWAVLRILPNWVGELRAIISQRLESTMEERLLDLLQFKSARLRLEAFERSDYHDSLQRARKAGRPGEFMNLLWNIFHILQGLLSVVAVAALVAAWSPLLLIAVLLTALPAPVAKLLKVRAGFWLRRKQTERERVQRYLEELLLTREPAKEIRTYGLADWLLARWEGVYGQVSGILYRHEVSKGIVHGSLRLLDAVGLAGGVGWAAWTVVTGSRSAGEFGAIIAALQSLKRGVTQAIDQSSYLAEQLLMIADLFVYLDLGPEEPAGGDTVDHPGDIQVVNVSFQYPKTEQPALSEVTFTLKLGEKVALVGENGSGKTTLVKVMTGLFQPTGGHVLVGGKDLAGLDQAFLRKGMAAVFQDFNRYAFTLQENIGYGRAEAVGDRAAVEQAAALGGADEVAATLPGGYDTQLTRQFEGGTELSGGQWQRVAMARGFMREAPLVVLDEPTASLDPRAETEVFHRFAALAGGRTALLVSHRLGVTRLCDRVLVLKEGRLVEQGSHGELLLRQGEYARMWALQSQWYQ